MLEKLIYIYVFLFGRPCFQKLNRLLYRLSLGGMGILNYKTSEISGEKYFLERYLSANGGTLIDVGANQGNYSIEAISIQKNLKVYAFEPHPVTFASLSRNTECYSNIIAINKGISSKAGILKLYDHPNGDGSEHASLYRDVITEIHGERSAIEHEVELFTLDDFIASENIAEIILLKIDTEGNEFEVLKGGAMALSQRKIRAIHFEFNEMNIYSHVFFRDFWRLLEGYQFFRLLPNGLLEIKNYSPLGCEIFAYQNIVAILKD